MSNIKSLRDRAKAFDAKSPIMEGREKGETKELLGVINTIDDYTILANEDGEPYAVVTFKERPKNFYFAGAVLTSRLIDLDGEGYHDAIASEGLPVLLKETKSKKTSRTYVSVEFYPEV